MMLSLSILQVMAPAADVGMEEALAFVEAGTTVPRGINQIQATVTLGVGILLLIALTVVGFRLVSKLFRRAGRLGAGGGSGAAADRGDGSFVNRYGERMTPDPGGLGWRTSDGRFFGASGAMDARPKGTGLVSPTRPFPDAKNID